MFGNERKEEYQAMRSPVDAEIRVLQKSLEEPQAEEHNTGLDLDGITATLHSLVDFSGATLNHNVINKFVYQVTPTSDTSFHWYINLNGNTKARAVYTVEGRKKKNVIKLEEIEEISSLHRKENEDATILIQTPLYLPYFTGCYQRKQVIADIIKQNYPPDFSGGFFIKWYCSYGRDVI